MSAPANILLAPHPATGRILWLDLVRVLAVYSIVVSHTYLEYLTLEQANFIKLFIGSAMPFIMASGSLIFPVRPSAGAFYRRRFRTYIPQFIVWSVVYALVQWHVSPNYDLTKALLYLPFAPTWGDGWFLYGLTGLYLIAPVISPWITSASPRQLRWFLAAWAFSGLTPWVIQQTYCNPLYTVVGPFYGFIGFLVAGYYLTHYPLISLPPRSRFLVLAAIFIVAVPVGIRLFITANRWGYAETLWNDLSINQMAMSVFWFALFSLCARGLLDTPAWLARAITVVSTASLGIYLMHTLIFEYILFPMGVAALPATLITIAASTLLAILSHRYLHF